jgi:hypothetical protein
MRRSGGGIVEAASAPRQHRAALAAVSCIVHTIQEGEAPGRTTSPNVSHSARRSDIAAG